MTARTFAELAKDSPAVGDVHISGSDSGKPKKPRKPRTYTQMLISGDKTEGDADVFAIKSEDRLVGTFKAIEILPDQNLIFGWASVVTKGGKLVVDKQGDVIEPEELEKAAYDFVLEARDHGHMHQTVGTGRMVESMMFTAEKQAALGVALGFEGWWVGFKVDSDTVWQAHKRGELPEFSIGGLAVPVDHEE